MRTRTSERETTMNTKLVTGLMLCLIMPFVYGEEKGATEKWQINPETAKTGIIYPVYLEIKDEDNSHFPTALRQQISNTIGDVTFVDNPDDAFFLIKGVVIKTNAGYAIAITFSEKLTVTAFIETPFYSMIKYNEVLFDEKLNKMDAVVPLSAIVQVSSFDTIDNSAKNCMYTFDEAVEQQRSIFRQLKNKYYSDVSTKESEGVTKEKDTTIGEEIRKGKKK